MGWLAPLHPDSDTDSDPSNLLHPASHLPREAAPFPLLRKHPHGLHRSR